MKNIFTEHFAETFIDSVFFSCQLQRCVIQVKSTADTRPNREKKMHLYIQQASCEHDSKTQWTLNKMSRCKNVCHTQ